MYLGFIIVPYPYNAAVLVVLTVCCRDCSPPRHRPSLTFWLSDGDSWLDLGGLISVESSGCRPLLSGSALLSLCESWVFSPAPALTLPSRGLFLHQPLLVSVCMIVSAVFYNVNVYISLSVCICVHVSISHPTSNQWCQPFDACSTLTKPYCSHICKHTDPHTYTHTYTHLPYKLGTIRQQWQIGTRVSCHLNA